MYSTDFHIEDEILLGLAQDESIITKESFHKLKNETLAKFRVSE